MRVFVKKTLRNYWLSHAETKSQLDSWYKVAVKSEWKNPHDIKAMYPKASIIANNRVVFDIVGGNYRLIVKFNYEFGWAFIRFIGTHSEYNNIDATEI
ncbi:MAG: type II toxin-antitoxin system HigB family toxin [Bacteroidetes bacterium]|nr:MAG: type II toxin-antitoxin system HigB family toxin [Bacteroidota bacterium]